MKCREETEWFCRARFGMFYHWGMFTGGGDSIHDKEAPFAFESADAFEKAAPDPETFARNLVGLTKDVGAQYLSLTCYHTCGKLMLICPSELPFMHKTKQDYLGAVIEETHKQGLKFIAYYPCGISLEFLDGYPAEWSSDEDRDAKTLDFQRQLFTEWRDRYGAYAIDGFWMDGYGDWSSVVDVFPNAVRIGNNQTMFHLRPRPDFGTTEFQFGRADPDYNRASGLRNPNDPKLPGWILPPRKDFNEDIPTCNAWWWHGKTEDNDYTKDPTFWVKEMICSVGQRRKWNYAMGLGPLLDGSAPDEFKPMMKTMGDFMKWASPAIIDTMGGECAPVQQGRLSANAFGTVTVPYDEEDTYYLLVTDKPFRNGEAIDMLQVQHDGVKVESITDLRTGDAYEFSDDGAIDILNITDWSDVENYGAKGFKIKACVIQV